MSPTPWDLPPRIAAKIAVDADTGCWLWTGARSGDGYGSYKTTTTTVAHRAVYELIAYPIPEGHELDHLCCVRQCVRPGHLEPVTRLENRRRSAEGMKKSVAYPCGHPRTPENTRARVWHSCLECHRISKRGTDRRRYARIRATQAQAA